MMSLHKSPNKSVADERLTRDAWIPEASGDQNALFIKELKAALARDGYVHLKGQFSLADYDRIAAELGAVFLVNEIRVINTDREKDVASNTAFGFHTDSVCAKFVSWYCITPGDEGEFTLLLDLADLTEHLPPPTCRMLSEIQIPAREPDVSATILSFTKDKVRVNFLPWRIRTLASAKHRTALTKFIEFIRARAAEPGGVIPIMLSQGEILIIDNHRVLHGRPPLNERTARNLRRFWISDDPNEMVRWMEFRQVQIQYTSSGLPRV